MNQSILERANRWLSNQYDEETREEVQKMIESNKELLEDAFYKDLEFGTGGMRGIMGVGTNRINKYTLGTATQGLANYLKEQFPNKEKSVAIAYDVRNNSEFFARIVADILTGNAIKVFLFESFRPTPELSYTVRQLSCDAGIVLTASHNPPDYNGFKVYWNDGGQIVPPQDQEIIHRVMNVKPEEIHFNGNDKLLQIIGTEIDQQFIDACVRHANFSQKGKENLKIVFTPLHGTAIKIMPEALRKAGFTNVQIVEEQSEPNGNFPTVKSPNPEEPEALKKAMDLADEIDADIVIGTDPDADRLGIAVRDFKGNLVLLNGNETNTVLTNYLLQQRENEGMDGTEFIGSTIVTSDIFFDLAELYNVECKVGLTGFKWIADMIRKAEGKQTFIGGGEESFGYMVGDFVRDKDSITSTLLACEIAAFAKYNNSSFFEELIRIYTQTHFYKEDLISVVKKGKDGAEQIEKMMSEFRSNPPKSFVGSEVIRINDYQTSISKDLQTGEIKKMEIPSSNVLIFYTHDGSKIAARPSGTEPKIKFYFSVKSELDELKDYEIVKEKLIKKLDYLKIELNKWLA